MTDHELLSDAAIHAAFEHRARPADVAGLREAILGETASLHQQRAWMAALEDVLAQPRTRRLVILLAVGALLSALTVGLLIVGGRPPALRGSSLMIITSRNSDCYQVQLGEVSTGTLRPMTGCVSGAQRMTVSPNGEHALFVRQGRLVVHDLADGAERELTSGDQLISYDHAYSWSPLGTWLTWTICPSRSSCTSAILPADGSGEPSMFTVRYGTDPSWSPDEVRLAVETPDGVLVANGDGSDPRRLGLDIPASFAWSPDGGQIAFERDGNVWLAPIDGTDAHPITDFEIGGIDEIAWSPDGQRLAVVRGAAIWLVALDGSRSRIDPGSLDGVGLGVSWAPNGEILAVGVDGPDESSSLLVPLDGRPSTLLPGAYALRWSADSRSIAYVGPDQSVIVANADGSGAHRVMPSVSAPDSMTWVSAGSMSGD